MIFNPVKYRQPVFGDSRCALYTLANIFDDRAFLLYRDVGVMTTHNEENEILKGYIKNVWNHCVIASYKIAGIYPYAIVPSKQRIPNEWIELQGEGNESFVISMVDCLAPDGETAHTIGVLWLSDGELVVIDPQKNDIVSTTRAAFFDAFHVVGVRFIYGQDMEISVFHTMKFLHIFNYSQ